MHGAYIWNKMYWNLTEHAESQKIFNLKYVFCVKYKCYDLFLLLHNVNHNNDLKILIIHFQDVKHCTTM